MIQITKEEAAILRKSLPTVSIHRTTTKYYVEETQVVLRVLRRTEGKGVG